MPRDFTSGNIGVRIYEGDCTVIEKRSGVHGWVECGQRFLLPLPDLFDSGLVTLAANELVHAARIYEKDNPGGELRKLLTATSTEESLMPTNEEMQAELER